MAVKMIVCDIDGTLVTDREKIIPLANIRALQKAQDAGILVTIASGRVASSLHAYAMALDIIDNCPYVVGSNGGAVLNCRIKDEVGKKTTLIKGLFFYFKTIHIRR